MQRVAADKKDWPDGCVSFRDVEAALLKMLEPLVPRTNANFSGDPPTSHWNVSTTAFSQSDIGTPTDRERATKGIVSYLMERLIWPINNAGGACLSENIFLLKNGELVDRPNEKVLHICDPVQVFPTLPPFPSDDEWGQSKGKANSFQIDEARTFRPSVVMDFLAFGSNRAHDHPFIDRQKWTVLDEPKLYLAQSGGCPDEFRDDECEELVEIWNEIRSFSGAEFVFRVPSGLASKRWKRASEIARGMKPEMMRIIFQTLPRKGSVYDREVLSYLVSLRAFLSEDVKADFTYEDLGKMLGIETLITKDRVSLGADYRAVRRLYRALKDHLK